NRARLGTDSGHLQHDRTSCRREPRLSELVRGGFPHWRALRSPSKRSSDSGILCRYPVHFFLDGLLRKPVPGEYAPAEINHLRMAAQVAAGISRVQHPQIRVLAD